MTDDDNAASPVSKEGQKGMQIYCGAQNPDYPGRYCTKRLKPEGGHDTPGGHYDGMYYWGDD